MASLIKETDVLNVLGNSGAAAASPEIQARIQMLLAAVIALAQSYTGRAIVSTNYTESYKGNGATGLTLRRQPVSAVSLVSVNNSVIPAAAVDSNGAYLTQSCGYGFNESGLFLMGGYTFCPSDFPNIYVKYTAGYATALPADMFNALVQEAAWQYQELGRLGKTGVRFADAGTETFKVTDLSPRAKLTLNNYRIFTALN